MLQLKVKPHLSKQALLKKLQGQKDIRLFQYWQIIYSVSTNPGKRAEEYASLLGINKEKVYRLVQLYNKEGAGFDTELIWGGRREERSHMSIKKEAGLLQTIEEKAIKGQVLTFNDIKKLVESSLGKSVSDDYIWDLFSRHNWKKKAPRPEHPQKDVKKQNAFKKNFRSYWVPASQK
jgi:transposase